MPSFPLRQLRVALALIIVVCCVALMSLHHLNIEQQQRYPSGVIRTHTGDEGYIRRSRWLWLSIDGDNFSNEDGLSHVNRVRMEGTVWLGENNEQQWRITHTGNLIVRIDNKIIFEVEGFNALRHDIVAFTSNDEFAHIEIDALVDINTPRTIFPYRTEMGIYEQNAFGGWSLIPTYHLFTGENIPDEALMQGIHTRILAAQIILAVFILLILIVIGTYARQYRIWQQRGIWIIGGITLIAVILRFIVMAERFTQDPFFHFIVPAGDDNYVLMGQQLLFGEYSLAGTFWPPAPIVWFAGVVAFLGPQLWKIYLANIVLSGFAIASVCYAAQIAFDSKRITIITGLILAFYPPLLFYQVTPQSVVLDFALISFALLFGVLAIKEEAYPYAASFGVMISLAGMSRGIALLLGLAFFISLMTRKQFQGIRLTVVAAIFSVLTLLPQIALNASATGAWSLVPYSNGNLTLYSGNNRDADGLWTGRGAAWEIERLTGRHWTQALIEDFQGDPMRMLELNLRKIGMFWNNHEYVSNVHYRQQGQEISTVIAALSQNNLVGMAGLSFFVWVGMTLLFNQRTRTTWFIFWSIIALALGTILFVLAGRLRVPVMPFLAIAAAIGISAIWESIITRTMSKQLIISLIIAVALAIIFPLMDAHLPRKSYVNVPSSAIRRADTFYDEIRLLGFDSIETDYAADGYFYITLYWEILQTPSHNYNVIVELADENGRLVGVDQPLASVTYPAIAATELRVGGIIQEGYLIHLPDADSLPAIASVNVGLYAPDSENDEVAVVNLFDLSFAANELLETSTLPDISTSYTIGAEFTVTIFGEPQLENNVVTIIANWQAQHQIYRSYVVFTQVVDDDNEIIAQIDSPTISGDFTVSSLNPNFEYGMQRDIVLPDDIPDGRYRVIMGVYEFPSLTRLPIYDSANQQLADDIIFVGEVIIER